MNLRFARSFRHWSSTRAGRAAMPSRRRGWFRRRCTAITRKSLTPTSRITSGAFRTPN